MKSINGTLTETLYGSVTINEDLHLDGNHSHNASLQTEVDDKDSNSDSMVQTLALFVAIASAIGLIVVLRQPEKRYLFEEE